MQARRPVSTSHYICHIWHRFAPIVISGIEPVRYISEPAHHVRCPRGTWLGIVPRGTLQPLSPEVWYTGVNPIDSVVLSLAALRRVAPQHGLRRL
jgi:hypothetical protein